MERLSLSTLPLLLLTTCDVREVSTTKVDEVRADFNSLLESCPNVEGVPQAGQTAEVDCMKIHWPDVNYIGLQSPRADGLTCVINDEGMVARIFDKDACGIVLRTLGTSRY